VVFGSGVFVSKSLLGLDPVPSAPSVSTETPELRGGDEKLVVGIGGSRCVLLIAAQ
jgi:hypothetical protein